MVDKKLTEWREEDTEAGVIRIFQIWEGVNELGGVHFYEIVITEPIPPPPPPSPPPTDIPPPTPAPPPIRAMQDIGERRW